MVGFAAFLFTLLVTWLSGNANPHNFQMAVLAMQYWYVLWATVIGIILVFACLGITFGAGFLGARAEGYLGWVLGLCGGGFISIVVLGTVYTIGWILPIYGTMLLQAQQIPGGIALILVGIVFNTWLTHQLTKRN